MEIQVAVVGAGTIGVGWAVAFARAGFGVRVHDPDPARLEAAPREVRARLDALATHGLLPEPAAEVAARVAKDADARESVRAAAYVQECAPEDVALKTELFGRLDALAPADAVLASSSSALPCSAFAGTLVGRSRCLIAHPGNPPFLLPIVELVPAPFTGAETVDRARAILERAGMSAVHVRKEVEGFVFNRLQGALLAEAYALVRDGVAGVEDVDRVVRHGLGRRWAFIGPFETADLNTRGGIEAHAARLGPAYERIAAERGRRDRLTPELVARVVEERRRLLPLDRWEERVAWRDRMLMQLDRLLRDAADDDGAPEPASRSAGGGGDAPGLVAPAFDEGDVSSEAE
jgi:L-gulonate 3-dehydrogenase